MKIQRRAPVLLLLAVSLLLSLALPGPARAERLAAGELAELLRGELVRHPVDRELEGGDYFGGVSYAVVDAPAGDVMAVLLDAGTYTSILPVTLEAREVGRQGDDRLVYFRHGGRRGSVGYTMVVHRQSPFVLRFWMDRTRPHEIGDCWGYFRVSGLGAGRTLLTYAALIHLDLGLIKLLFREKIRSVALGTPLLVRRYLGAHAPSVPPVPPPRAGGE